MPTLGDAIGVIGRIFDFSQPMMIEIKSLHVFAFMVMGTAIMFAKDLLDELFPTHFDLLSNRHAIVRWASYILLIAIIMLTGVFDAGQFIYANF